MPKFRRKGTVEIIAVNTVNISNIRDKCHSLGYSTSVDDEFLLIRCPITDDAYEVEFNKHSLVFDEHTINPICNEHITEFYEKIQE